MRVETKIRGTWKLERPRWGDKRGRRGSNSRKRWQLQSRYGSTFTSHLLANQQGKSDHKCSASCCQHAWQRQLKCFPALLYEFPVSKFHEIGHCMSGGKWVKIPQRSVVCRISAVEWGYSSGALCCSEHRTAAPIQGFPPHYCCCEGIQSRLTRVSWNHLRDRPNAFILLRLSTALALQVQAQSWFFVQYMYV